MSQARLADVLFQSATRSTVLRALFVERKKASVSELARLARLTSRTVGREVRQLEAIGLVQVVAERGADIVSAVATHPAASALRTLLRASAVRDTAHEDASTRANLAAWGAPLDVRLKAGKRAALHDTLLDALELARRDGTVLRVLPAVLARNLDAIDWPVLTDAAKARKLKSELGWLIEQTADLLARPELTSKAAPLRDRRVSTPRFFPAVASRFEQELARKRSPRAARSWGFWMNVPEESFRTTLERHA